MTVEEIEIIVTAKVEEALKEFKKILPTIKQSMKQAQDAFSEVDTKTMQNKLSKAVQFMKKKMQDFKRSTENNEIAIKVTNTDAQRQIRQIEKEINSLQSKISARQLKLDFVKQSRNQMFYDNGGFKNSKENLSQNKTYVNLGMQEKRLSSEIQIYNKLLDNVKRKMIQLQNETNSLNKKTKNVIEPINNISNGYKNMSKGIKNGVKQVTRYALALFSLRGIYSVLSSSAQSWLSSQNVEAKQLSANIDYMKYSLGQALAPVIEFITNCIYNLLKAIQAIIYALFRVNIFANASSKAYSAMAGNAKKAKNETKQLAGVHDEINNISDDNSSDSGSGGTPAPSFDLSKIQGDTPAWLQWIIDNKGEILAIIAGVIAGIVAIKMGLSGIQALGIGIAVAGIVKLVQDIITFIQSPSWQKFSDILLDISVVVAGIALLLGGSIGITLASISALIAGIALIIQGVINYLNDPSWKNFITILAGIALAVGAVLLLVGGIPALITGIILLVAAIGIAIYKHWKEVKEVLRNSRTMDI